MVKKPEVRIFCGKKLLPVEGIYVRDPGNGIFMIMDMGFYSRILTYSESELSRIPDDLAGFFGHVPNPEKYEYDCVPQEIKETISRTTQAFFNPRKAER